jgi:hypothetical protein
METPTPDPDFPDSSRTEDEHRQSNKKRRWLMAGAFVLTFGLGGALGAAGAADTPAKQAKDNVGTISELEERETNLDRREVGLDKRQAEIDAWEPPEPETVEVEVERTPAVCIEFIDLADQQWQNTADLMGVVDAWYNEMFTIIDTDGFMITDEWNELDTRYAGEMEAIIDTFAESVEDFVTLKEECYNG